MAGTGRTILLVADRLGVHDDGWSVSAFLDRLERRGLTAQVMCVESAGEAATDFRVVECPGVGRRWGKSLAVRGLRLGERLLRPDLVHVLQSKLSDIGLAIVERWRVPYVQTIDEFMPRGGRLRLSRRWCRKLVATSRELADELTTVFGVPSSMVALVNPGIEPPTDVRHQAEQRVVKVIGTAGPLVASSGFATFLNAARRVVDGGVDAEFVIAGQGEDEVDLRRRAERLRIAERVTFAGTPVVGLRFWSVLDIFCQPSLVASVGRTLATALAFGVPAIASDIEGLRALVTHDLNGLRVPPGDAGALARTIFDLLADADRGRALGAQGRAIILRDFEPEVEVRQLAEVYEEILGREAPGAEAPAFATDSETRFS